MVKSSDFQVGDRVRLPFTVPGTVTQVKNGWIRVRWMTPKGLRTDPFRPNDLVNIGRPDALD
mgnify:CR=1 FL=1